MLARRVVSFSALMATVVLVGCDGEDPVLPEPRIGPAAITAQVRFEGEPFEGIGVILRDAGGEDLGTVQTGGDGQATFSDLEPGSYSVLVNCPTIWLPLADHPPEVDVDLQSSERVEIAFAFRLG